MPGAPIPGAMPAPPVATSCPACSPDIFCSDSHAVHVSVCLRLIGNSGIQNSVNFVVSFRSTCSQEFPHWPHASDNTASTCTYWRHP